VPLLGKHGGHHLFSVALSHARTVSSGGREREKIFINWICLFRRPQKPIRPSGRLGDGIGGTALRGEYEFFHISAERTFH